MEECNQPLSSGLAGACKSARLGLGLPSGPPHAFGMPRPYLPPELVRLIDAYVRRLERELRLLALHAGHLGLTLVAAARAGGSRDVRFLLAAGADSCLPAALRAASAGGHLEVLRALLAAPPAAALTPRDLGDALSEAALAGRAHCVRSLVAAGARVNFHDGRPLLWAALRGEAATVVALLELGADARACGGLAAAWAAEAGFEGVAALLRGQPRLY